MYIQCWILISVGGHYCVPRFQNYSGSVGVIGVATIVSPGFWGKCISFPPFFILNCVKLLLVCLIYFNFQKLFIIFSLKICF